jgi:hypothetical protein
MGISNLELGTGSWHDLHDTDCANMAFRVLVQPGFPETLSRQRLNSNRAPTIGTGSSYSELPKIRGQDFV